MNQRIICKECGQERYPYGKELCTVCYRKKYTKKEKCEICEQVKTKYAKGLCQSCYSRVMNHVKGKATGNKRIFRANHTRGNGRLSIYAQAFEDYFKRLEQRYPPVLRDKFLDKRAVCELFISSVCEISGPDKCGLVEAIISSRENRKGLIQKYQKEELNKKEGK